MKLVLIIISVMLFMLCKCTDDGPATTPSSNNENYNIGDTVESVNSGDTNLVLIFMGDSCYVKIDYVYIVPGHTNYLRDRFSFLILDSNGQRIEVPPSDSITKIASGYYWTCCNFYYQTGRIGDSIISNHGFDECEYEPLDQNDTDFIKEQLPEIY